MMATRLSKSRYLAGLQCLKRLYLEIHARELATPFDAGTQAILDVGTRVGELARGEDVAAFVTLLLSPSVPDQPPCPMGVDDVRTV